MDKAVNILVDKGSGKPDFNVNGGAGKPVPNHGLRPEPTDYTI